MMCICAANVYLNADPAVAPLTLRGDCAWFTDAEPADWLRKFVDAAHVESWQGSLWQHSILSALYLSCIEMPFP